MVIHASAEGIRRNFAKHIIKESVPQQQIEASGFY
jgi:hypothetical protein